MNGKSMDNKTITSENLTRSSAQAGKKFAIGWLLPIAVLGFFIGHFWGFIPSFRGIVSLFVFSKFLAGLSGTHLLL